jgi:hypothetical protein
MKIAVVPGASPEAAKPPFSLANEDRPKPHVTGAATVKRLQGPDVWLFNAAGT